MKVRARIHCKTEESSEENETRQKAKVPRSRVSHNNSCPSFSTHYFVPFPSLVFVMSETLYSL